jgi:oxygen-independent coproporphyrinogen III oxidase
MNSQSGVYLHIPFCASRCHYCNFATGGYEENLAQKYVEAICTEIQKANIAEAMQQIDTIYFGGGTPSTLTIPQFESILDQCKSKFVLDPKIEITAEANPGSLTLEYLSHLRTIGINRLSIGVQSFLDRELEMIGRGHVADDARSAVKMARQAGFTNLSLDLIAGLPEQSIETWRDNISSAMALEPEHLSVYLLELYQDAPLMYRIKRGELQAIDDELTVQMYYELVDAAEKNGYVHYELSNWAKPGFESRHNLKYWNGALYHAFGMSAAGYDGNSRWSNIRNLNHYLERIEKAESVIDETTELTLEDQQSEAIFLRLRLKDGVNLAHYSEAFGVDIKSKYETEIERLVDAGVLEFSGDSMMISRRGKVLANEVFEAFI